MRWRGQPWRRDIAALRFCGTGCDCRSFPWHAATHGWNWRSLSLPLSEDARLAVREMGKQLWWAFSRALAGGEMLGPPTD